MHNLVRSALSATLLALTALPAGAVDSRSGFIENLPLLAPDKQRLGAVLWIKHGIDLSRYGRIALNPVEVFIDPSSPYKGVSPDDLKVIGDTIHKTIAERLAPDYPLVDKTGEGVLYVRLALTRVLVKKKKRGLPSFTPTGFTLTALQEIAGGRTSLKNAVFEAELYDGASGERIGVLLDELDRSAGKKEYTWDAVVAAADFYARRFRGRLDAARK